MYNSTQSSNIQGDTGTAIHDKMQNLILTKILHTQEDKSNKIIPIKLNAPAALKLVRVCHIGSLSLFWVPKLVKWYTTGP